MTDTLYEVLSKKSKQKLAEVDYRICDSLRQPVLQDDGDPSIKERLLQIVETSGFYNTLGGQELKPSNMGANSSGYGSKGAVGSS